MKKPKRRRPFREEITDLPNLITLARIGTLPLVLLFIDNYSRIASFIWIVCVREAPCRGRSDAMM